MSFGSAMMACEQAGIVPGAIAPERLAVCFGSEMLFSQIHEVESTVNNCKTEDGVDTSKWAPQFMSSIYPLWMLMSLPNMAACHIGIALDSRGPNNTITTDETSSLMAIHEAFMQIQRGDADVVVVGTTGSRVNPTRMLQHPREHYIHTRVDGPEASVRPFDADRLGMALGEGSGCIVLEDAEHAAKRNVKVLGRIASVASGFARPEKFRSGSSQAISNTVSLALERAGISTKELDYINTSGCGSIALDATHAQGIANMDASIPMVAIQGATGFMGASMGMCELIASILAAQDDGQSPWTINHRTSDPMIENPILTEPGRKMQRPYIAKYSQTPHGQTAAVVIKLLDN